jgi:transposase
MKLNGASGQEIASTLGVRVRTVYLWMGDPLAKVELERQVERVNELFAQRLTATALTSVEQLQRLLEMPVPGPITPRWKLEAIREAIRLVELWTARRDTASSAIQGALPRPG